MRHWDAAPVVLLAAACLAGCGQQQEPPALEVVQVPKVEVKGGIDPHELDDAIVKIERATNTTVGLSLYDGDVTTKAGSVSSLPAWSTIKVPMSFAAQEHCEYDEDALSGLIESAIEISDNDATDQLWYCLDAAGGAQDYLRDEIGSKIDVAWGRTEWPLPAQARYAWDISQRSDVNRNEVVEHMRHIDEEQSWGLGELGIPFKGGWGDVEEDGSWQSRQMGFGDINGVLYGIAVGAVSDNGSFQDTVDAIDAVVGVLTGDKRAVENIGTEEVGQRIGDSSRGHAVM